MRGYLSGRSFSTPETAAMSTHNQPPDEPDAVHREVTFLTIMKSVFSAFIGVQSNANRKRDFESGKFWHFFFAGLIFVVIFVMAVWLAVNALIATTATG